MRFPKFFERPASRDEIAAAENRAYTQGIIDAAAQSSGSSAIYSAATEIAAGTIGRAFAVAEPGERCKSYFTPSILASIGRDLIVRGQWFGLVSGNEIIYLVDVDVQEDGKLFYASLDGKKVDATDMIIHVRYSIEGHTGHGVGPLARLENFRELNEESEKALKEEIKTPRGNLMPLPKAGQSEAQYDALKMRLATGKGGLTMVDTLGTGGGYGQEFAPKGAEYKTQRYGAEIPDVNLALWIDTKITTLAVCGVPIEIIVGGSDATAKREAYRQFMTGTLMPLGELVIEAANKVFARLASPMTLTLDWRKMQAADIQSRTRSAKQMTESGWSKEEAAFNTGLTILTPETARESDSE